ncbi:MAG: hypothetical protein ACRYFA_13880 [Janthinobacterium lividum]
MTTRKLTLAFISLLTVGMLQACNGSHDKTSMDTQSGQPAPNSSTSGNDSSETNNNRRDEVSGVNSATSASGNPNANQTTTAQGMTGADSVYQKSTQKSNN